MSPKYKFYNLFDSNESMQRGFRLAAGGGIVFGTHDNKLQAFASNVDGYVAGDRGVGTQEG